MRDPDSRSRRDFHWRFVAQPAYLEHALGRVCTVLFAGNAEGKSDLSGTGS